MLKFAFTDDQAASIVNALMIAATQYDSDAQTCRGVAGHERMAEQFMTQARNARALADSIANGGE